MIPNRFVLMNSREQRSVLQTAAAREEKVRGALPATQLHHCTKWHLKTFKNFLQRLTLLHSSLFVSNSVSFNAAKRSSCVQCSSCPCSHQGKRHRCWRAFWQLSAPLTGFHFTRKNCHLFSGWTITQEHTEITWHCNSHCYPAPSQNKQHDKNEATTKDQ